MTLKTILGVLLAASSASTLASAAEGPASAALVLGVQRAKLLEQAPFRIEYKRAGYVDAASGKRVLPRLSGSAVFDKDGRFIIVEKSVDKNDVEPSVFAWDGKKLYKSMESNSTYFIGQSDFAPYVERDEDPTLLARVPVIDMFEALGPKPEGKRALSPSGVNLRMDCLDVFGYMSIYDMYYSETAGKIGPRWVDVADNGLFAKSAALSDAVVAGNSKEPTVVFRSSESRQTKRGTAYFHQVYLGKQGSTNASKVVKYLSRGPWMSVARQTNAEIKQSDLNELLLCTGTVSTFEYKKGVAGGWLPSASTSVTYEQKIADVGKATAADPARVQEQDSFPAGVLRSERTWETVQFDKLSQEDCTALFDQFVISQKNMINLTKMAGWKSRYPTSPSSSSSSGK